MRCSHNERRNLHVGPRKRQFGRNHRLIDPGRTKLFQQNFSRQRQELKVHQVPLVLNLRQLPFRWRQIKIPLRLRHKTQDVASEGVPDKEQGPPRDFTKAELPIRQGGGHHV